MRTFLLLLFVLAAGVAGLALVFTDLLPEVAGMARLAVGGAFYFLAGLVAAGASAGRGAWRWAAATAWAMALLGVVGVWISVTDPASGDLPLALAFLLGPLACALLGGAVGAALGRAHR